MECEHENVPHDTFCFGGLREELVFSGPLGQLHVTPRLKLVCCCQNHMKNQDKALLRQFLDLRAAIRSLRADGGRLRALSYGGKEEKLETMRQESTGSDVKGDASADDDDVFGCHGNGSSTGSLLQEQCSLEFRGRTTSCVGPRERYQVPTRHTVLQ